MSLKNPIDKSKHPNVHEGYNYALGVVVGEIPNSKYVIGACERFLKDYEESIKPHSKYIFHVEYVERYLRTVQIFEHVIGHWETDNIQYMPWQKWLWSAALGFKHRSNTRNPKYRTLHIEIPRGCAKSTMASQCALYFLGLEPDRRGEKIACFATKNDQSRIILDAARNMALKSSKYLKSSGVEVLAHKMVDGKTNSEMIAMSSDSKSMDGLNLRIAFCDELHAMTRELFEVITSGQKKRRDSITVCLTTAGFNHDGIGYSQSQYSKKVCIGEVIDEAFFAVIFTIDEGDDIFEESTWKKANPNYGHSVDPEAFRSTAEKARHTPSDLPNFKVKNLNIWLSEANAFFDIDKWDACTDPDLKIENFLTKRCYAGIDLASKIDLTAHVKVFREKGIYYIFHQAFIPRETAEEARNVLYDNSEAAGELIYTTGEAISLEKIQEYVLKESKKFNTLAVHYDPWNSTQLAQNLLKERVNMVEFRMSTANLSEAMKMLDALIRSNKVRHNGGQLLKWCMSNVVSKEDQNGNVFPRKSSDKLKIDLAVALIMAMAGWIAEKDTVSIYESRGVIAL